MGRIGATTVATAALAVLFAVLVAPAMPARPPVADAVDFEAAAPAPQPLASRAGASVLRAYGARLPVRGTVRPGRRFNLVGLHWRGGRVTGLRVRVRRDGSEWSRWVTAATDADHGPDADSREARHAVRASDPVWAGQADQVQIRAWAGPGARDLRLHFVDTAGATARLARLRQTVPGAPAIVPRAAWAGDDCPPRAAPSYGEVKLAFIHHTVSANDYGPEDSAAMVLGICRYHRNSNGWNDIGYNFLVDRYGTIFEGRAGGIAEAVVGAQAQGYNGQSTGIASLGTFSTTGQTDAGLRALATILSWKLGVHGVPAQGQVSVTSGGGSTNRFPGGARVTFDRITGHRDANATACPGDGLYAQLDQLRAMVNPGPPRAATVSTAGAARRNVVYGQKAVLKVGLTAGGAPLAGKKVDVQMLGRLGWRTQQTVSTNGAGTAETSVRVFTNRSLRARYAGEPTLLPSSSPVVPVGVRARVTLSLGATAVQPRQAVPVSGTVRPRKGTAVLTVKRRTSTGRLVLVSRRTVRLRKGRLRTTVRAKRPALYRVRLSTRRDARNLAARSAAVAFRVG